MRLYIHNAATIIQCRTIQKFMNMLRNLYSCARNIRVGVLGVPFEEGSRYNGSATAPKLLKDYGLIDALKNHVNSNIDVKEYEDVQWKENKSIEKIPANMYHYKPVVSATEEISKRCFNILNEDRICLTLGGDHSIGIGTVDGHVRAKKNVSLLWVDAHADINTNHTTITGNIHGMPVAIIVKELAERWPHLPGMDWHKPGISIENLAYIGLRSVDPLEKVIIQEMGITAFEMEDVKKHGIESIITMALQKIDPLKNRSIHVSFDIDALDALEVPSTILPVHGGLTLEEGLHIMTEVHKTGRLGAMDLVEINPTIGDAKDLNRTLEAATQLVIAAFGGK